MTESITQEMLLISTEIVQVGFSREVLEKALKSAFNKIDYLEGLNNKLQKVEKAKRIKIINSQIICLSEKAKELHQEKQHRFQIEIAWRELVERLVSSEMQICVQNKTIELLQGQLTKAMSDIDEWMNKNKNNRPL